jgi:hypothetical protein
VRLQASARGITTPGPETEVEVVAGQAAELTMPH